MSVKAVIVRPLPLQALAADLHPWRPISDGSYTGNGYENAAWGYPTPAAALNGWKNSSGHNDVILNQGIWSNITWRAMGVGIRGTYYYLWFSDSTDYSSPLAACDGIIFSNGFE